MFNFSHKFSFIFVCFCLSFANIIKLLHVLFFLPNILLIRFLLFLYSSPRFLKQPHERKSNIFYLSLLNKSCLLDFAKSHIAERSKSFLH